MSIINSIKKSIKDSSFKHEILFRYTEKIKHNIKWNNLLLDNKYKIFYINYPDDCTYIVAGQSKKYIIDSNKKLTALKKLKYKIQSYGENQKEQLKIFGGISFNVEQEPKDIWKDLPKGLFFIPRFLITKNKKEYFVSFHTFINPTSDIQKIKNEYESFKDNLNNLSQTQMTDIIFDKNIPNKKTYSEIFSILSKSIKSKNVDKVVLSRIKKFLVTNKIILKDISCTNFYIDLETHKRFLGATPELLIKIKISFGLICPKSP